MHIKIPRFQLAHLGSLFLLQSAHTLFPGNFSSDLMMVWLAAALSAALAAAGLGRRDIAEIGDQVVRVSRFEDKEGKR